MVQKIYWCVRDDDKNDHWEKKKKMITGALLGSLTLALKCFIEYSAQNWTPTRVLSFLPLL